MLVNVYVHMYLFICRLVDEFHSQLGEHETASDGIITDLDYSSEMYTWTNYVLWDIRKHNKITNLFKELLYWFKLTSLHYFMANCCATMSIISVIPMYTVEVTSLIVGFLYCLLILLHHQFFSVNCTYVILHTYV